MSKELRARLRTSVVRPWEMLLVSMLLVGIWVALAFHLTQLRQVANGVVGGLAENRAEGFAGGLDLFLERVRTQLAGADSPAWGVAEPPAGEAFPLRDVAALAVEADGAFRVPGQLSPLMRAGLTVLGNDAPPPGRMVINWHPFTDTGGSQRLAAAMLMADRRAIHLGAVAADRLPTPLAGQPGEVLRYALVRTDGAVVAQMDAAGRLQAEVPLVFDANDQAMVAGLAAGRLHGAQMAHWNGRHLALALHRLRNLPLGVLAVIDTGQASAGLRAARRLAFLGAGLGTAIVLLAAGLWFRYALQAHTMSGALVMTLESMTQGIIMSNRAGCVEIINDRARDLLELDPDQQYHNARLSVINERLGTLLASTAAGNAKFLRRMQSGREVETEQIVRADGCVLMACTDVSERNAAEAARQQALGAAQSANRAKSDFVANMSHEIRTPMNGVLGMLQALRQTDLSPQQKQMCDVLDRSGQMLIRVLNDILDYSKLEAGKIVLEMVPVNVMELVDDVSSLIIPSAEAKGLQITVTHRDQPPLLLLDPTRLRQILSNLLSNAVKFSRHGKIYVELAAAVDAANLDHTNVIIRVRDTGIGMSADTVQRLFTRFTQADASATRKFGGTGLGLAISRELATLMNGDISVTSALGLGSEFVVHLRAQHAPQGALEVAGDDAPCLLRAGHALRILVAEDMEVNRIVLASLFSATGHQLSFAHDGRAAVAMVQQAEYDVVLMDIMMPEMDGLDATRAIRALGGAYEIIPIIALTADVLSEERERYTRLGMNACVAKPIVRAELFGTLNRIMGFDCQARTDDTAGAPVTEDAVEDDLLNAIDGLFGHAAPAA